MGMQRHLCPLLLTLLLASTAWVANAQWIWLEHSAPAAKQPAAPYSPHLALVVVVAPPHRPPASPAGRMRRDLIRTTYGLHLPPGINLVFAIGGEVNQQQREELQVEHARHGDLVLVQSGSHHAGAFGLGSRRLWVGSLHLMVAGC